MSHYWENCWMDTTRTKATLFHLFLREIQPILESCDWLKTPTMWLTKSILGHIWGTRIFPNIKFVQAYSNYNNTDFYYRPNRQKIKELRNNSTFPYIQRTLSLATFLILGAKHYFQNICLSCTTLYAPLTSRWVPQKTKKPIPRKLPQRRTDRPYSYDLSGHGQGSCRRIS